MGFFQGYVYIFFSLHLSGFCFSLCDGLCFSDWRQAFPIWPQLRSMLTLSKKFKLNLRERAVNAFPQDHTEIQHTRIPGLLLEILCISKPIAVGDRSIVTSPDCGKSPFVPRRTMFININRRRRELFITGRWKPQLPQQLFTDYFFTSMYVYVLCI